MLSSQYQKKNLVFATVAAVLLLGFQNCSKTGFNSSTGTPGAQKSNSTGAAPNASNVVTSSGATAASGINPVVPRTPGSVGASPSIVPMPVIEQPVNTNKNPVSSALPIITAALSPTTTAAGAGAELSYTISNLSNSLDSYTIDITNKSTDRATQLGNISQCRVPNQVNCTAVAGTSLRFLYSSYLQSKPSDFYTVLITATNSKGTVTLLIPFNYVAPSVAPSPVATSPVACSYAYTPAQVCQPNNIQSVIAVGSPLGCVGTPAATQTCKGPQSNVCPAGQMFSMASQTCVSQCRGTQALQIIEADNSTPQSALIPIGYNMIAGYQFILNGTLFVLGQKLDSTTLDLNNLGAQMLNSASHADFVNAFNTSINANAALAGQVQALLGGEFTYYSSYGNKATAQEILLKSAGTFSLPTTGFYIRNNSPASSSYATTVYCKD